MGFLDLLRRRAPLYGGGSGETIENSVIITTTDTPSGVAAEYRYVSRKCGRPDADWTFVSQALVELEDGRHYDVLKVRLKGGEVREFYFDITSFFGRF